MKRSIFLIITAILGVFAGVMCLFFPDKMAAGFGMTVTPVIIMLIREAGACNLSMGYLNFAVRNDPDSKTLKAVLIFNMAYHLLILPANIYGWSKGILSTGQVIPAFSIHLLFAIVFLLYALKIKPSAQPGKVMG
jgi:hypothetical protein